MKSLLVVSFVLILTIGLVAAADAPRVEVSGGYSYLHIDTGGDGLNTHGWDASVVGNVNRWFGLAADFSGHYRSIGVSIPQLGDFSANGNVHLFLFGPRFKLRAGAVEPFAHVLGGFARAEGSVGVGPGGSARVSDTAPAFAIGGGLDIRAGEHYAVRVIQGDYIYTRFADVDQNSARISVGFVLRFGDVD